jgi:DNA-binding winged helix-turn-helix (wHTH) protein
LQLILKQVTTGPRLGVTGVYPSLIQAIWPNVIVTDEVLTHCVSEVRQAIGDSRQAIIATLPRRGYQFAAIVSRIAANASAGNPVNLALAPTSCFA